jgi:hypothetical protein
MLFSLQTGKKQKIKINPKFKCNTASVSPSVASGVVSSKEENEKKGESGDSFVKVYLRLPLTCLLLSAICCCRLCLFRVLLDACPFCFLQYTALPTFAIAIFLFIYRSGGERPSPTL